MWGHDRLPCLARSQDLARGVARQVIEYVEALGDEAGRAGDEDTKEVLPPQAGKCLWFKIPSLRRLGPLRGPYGRLA